MLTPDWWDGPLPRRADLGARYPRASYRVHAMTSSFRRRLDGARRVVDQAGDLEGWDLCLSAGKDSTALALLLAGSGARAVSIRDTLCWQGEDRYLAAVTSRCGLALHMERIEVDLLELARATSQSLTADTEDHGGAVSRHWFAATRRLDAEQPRGKLWGLRAEENPQRRMNRALRGPLYTRADGLQICAPLSDWSALDVHAMLALHDVPPHPVYLCVDPGADPLRLRHSWWAYGGRGRAKHYQWLQRWWPEVWDLACEVDPSVAALT